MTLFWLLVLGVLLKGKLLIMPLTSISAFVFTLSGGFKDRFGRMTNSFIFYLD